MQPTDIETLVSLSRPSVAPDGSFVVIATSRPHLRANTYVGQLHRYDVRSGELRRLTRGVADSTPVVAPDSTRIAFLRADGNGKAQVFIVPANGGEAVQVTDAPMGVSTYQWAPNGTSIVFSSVVPQHGRYGSVEGLDATSEAPRHITTLQWHSNGVGYVTDRASQLFLIEVPSVTEEPQYATAASTTMAKAEAVSVARTAKALTAGTVGVGSFAIDPTGQHIAAVPTEFEVDERSLSGRIVKISVSEENQNVAAADEVLSSDRSLAIDSVTYANDGSLALLGFSVGDSGVDFIAPGVALFLVDAVGVPRQISDGEVLDLGEVGSAITPVGSDFLVQSRARGRVTLVKITRGGETSSVIDGDVEVGGVDATLVDGKALIAVTAATPDSFGELIIVDGDSTNTVSDFSADLRNTGLASIREHTIQGRDGYSIHGWSATPEGNGPHPTILLIHGGPYAQYGIHPFDEVQTLVSAGYGVVYSNPRGSAGYGREHGRSIRQKMGTLDFADVIDFLEGVLSAEPRLDADRLGIMGGSYGGYLTAWTIAHDNRFAAAIVERGFLDPETMMGTSDIGTFFGQEYVGESAEDIARQSPYAHVDAVKTPTFVVHSELDFRCPLEQATRYYSALKRRGVETEMLIFPGENHELTRSGSPRHRVERFNAVLDWWNRYLPVS